MFLTEITEYLDISWEMFCEKTLFAYMPRTICWALSSMSASGRFHTASICLVLGEKQLLILGNLLYSVYGEPCMSWILFLGTDSTHGLRRTLFILQMMGGFTAAMGNGVFPGRNSVPVGGASAAVTILVLPHGSVDAASALDTE